MGRLTKFFALTAMLLPLDAQASPAKFWSKVGSWSFSIDSNLGNGCFALAQWEGGSVIRIGLDPRAPLTGYVILVNEKWKSLEVGKKYKISITFDENAPWDVPMKVIDLSGSKALYSDLDSDLKFMDEFSTSTAVHIKYQGTSVDNLNLTGSAAVTKAIIDCQKAQTANDKKKSEDPFSTISTAPDDPFAK